MAAALLAIAAIATVAQRTAGQIAVCNATCQAGQREALQSLYTSLAGSSWRNNTGWTLASNVSASSGWPAHCSWAGVACCTPAGLAQYRFSAYAYPAPISCSSAAAVAGLFLVSQGLAGQLPAAEQVWGPLASVVYLSLTGGGSACWLTAPASFHISSPPSPIHPVLVESVFCKIF